MPVLVAAALAPLLVVPKAPEPPVAYPHPLITEILYAVPSGPAGDANGDGKRDAAGDEFIELVNPHDRPINLRGYRITDRNEPDKGQLKFVFPALELPPGGVVVVFNGFGAKWEGPVGDSKRAPEAGNEKFGGAIVLTMKGASAMTSWANGGDWALLSDPSGSPVQCVWWGKFNETLPTSGLVEQATLTTKGSITRNPEDFSWAVHADLDDLPFSPGRWGTGRPPAPEQAAAMPETTAEKPAQATPDAGGGEAKPADQPGDKPGK
jgi:hypothetical protein